MKRGLMDSVFGFYRPSSGQSNEFLLIRKRVLPSVANSASGLFLVFPTTSSIVSGKIIFTSLRLLITAVVQVIGANDPIVANPIGLRRTRRTAPLIRNVRLQRRRAVGQAGRT